MNKKAASHPGDQGALRFSLIAVVALRMAIGPRVALELLVFLLKLLSFSWFKFIPALLEH